MIDICQCCVHFSCCPATSEPLVKFDDDSKEETVSATELQEKYPFIKGTAYYFFNGGESVIVLACDKFSPVKHESEK